MLQMLLQRCITQQMRNTHFATHSQLHNMTHCDDNDCILHLRQNAFIILPHLIWFDTAGKQETLSCDSYWSEVFIFFSPKLLWYSVRTHVIFLFSSKLFCCCRGTWWTCVLFSSLMSGNFRLLVLSWQVQNHNFLGRKAWSRGDRGECDQMYSVEAMWIYNSFFFFFPFSFLAFCFLLPVDI